MTHAAYRRVAPLACAFSLALFACGSDDDGPVDGPGTQEQTLVGAFGNVVDTDGAPVAGATIEVGGDRATSDADGSFVLELPTGSHVVTIRATGYLPVFLPVDVMADTASRVDATLLAMAAPVTVDISAGGEATGPNGGVVTIPAGALVDGSGAVVTGEVQVFLTPYDPTDEAQLAAYPGPLTAEPESGGLVQLQTYAVLDVTITQNGQELDVADGATISAAIPVPDGLASTPETVGLWSFDDERGIWIEEGVATLDAGAGVYRAELPHLSPWNCDDPMEVTCIEGTAVDASGNPVPGARVRAVGLSIIGSSETTADASGNFCAFAPPSSQVRLSVIHGDGGGSIQEVTTGDSVLATGAACGGSCTSVGGVTIAPGEVTVTDDDGETTTIDCVGVADPLAGTCAEGLGDMFECFSPAGECVVRLGSGNGTTIEYANGARIVTSGGMGGDFTVEYLGPDGRLCGTGSGSGDGGAEITISGPSGEGPWRIRESDTAQIVECPNGDQISLSSEEFDRFEACSGGAGTDQQCDMDTGGAGQCSADTDCGAGMECCDFGGMQVCAPTGSCGDGEGFCATDGDCEGEEICCEISGVNVCAEADACEASAGCTDDSDCDAGMVCCEFGGVAACVPPAGCPGG